MTIMHIQVPDDLVQAAKEVFPVGAVESAVAAWLKSEIERRQKAATLGSESLVEMARRIQEQTPPTSYDQIRALREEGRP